MIKSVRRKLNTQFLLFHVIDILRSILAIKQTIPNWGFNFLISMKKRFYRQCGGVIKIAEIAISV